MFGFEIEGCARCGGKLGIIASIEEPQVIAKILAHLEKAAGVADGIALPRRDAGGRVGLRWLSVGGDAT